MRLPLLAAALLLPAGALAQSPFVLKQEDAPRRSTAALWTDVNGDGETDLVFGDGSDQNGVFLWRGQGRFRVTRVTTAGRPFTDGVFADFDNDGDQDLAVGSLNRGALLLNTNGRYEVVESALESFSTQETRGISSVDIDNDGWLDVFLVRRFGRPNLLYRGSPDGFVYQPGAHEAPSNSNAACWADFDQDGDVDLYVANGTGEADVLYRNDSGALQPAQTFPASSPSASSTVCSWGDANGDGDLDLFVGSSSGNRSRLLLNRGGQLEDAPERSFPAVNLDLFGAVWGDVDNDGDLDLVVAGRNSAAWLFRNDGGQTAAFEIEPSLTGPTFGVAAALADYDRDGDLDLAIANGNTNVSEPSYVFDNDSEGGNWLQVKLVGTASNRDGIGARLEARVRIGGRVRGLVRERRTHEARRSQSGPHVHFGLGDAQAVTQLTVRWPSGTVQTLTDLPVNGFIEIVEPEDAPAGKADVVEEKLADDALALRVAPNPSRGRVRIDVQGAGGAPTTLEAVDLQGRRVWTTVSSSLADQHTVDWNPESDLASGVYIIRATRGGQVVSMRVTLVR